MNFHAFRPAVRPVLPALCMAILLASPAVAAMPSRPVLSLDVDDAPPSSTADKSAYTLFNPTPAFLMREFNSDRPDVTESPFTVDAGHFQLELSFLEYTHDTGQGNRTDAFSILPFNFKVGLLNNLDLQLVVNPQQNIRMHGGGISHRNVGFGDLELRTKLNLWGNDGGTTAGGIMPFVKIPSGTGGLSNHHVEGGLILPLAVKLPGDFDLGTMAEFDVNRNQRNDGYGVDFVHTVTLGHQLFDKLNGYIEYAGVSPIGTAHTYLAYFDTGVEYALAENIQIDTGINIGLSEHANDFTLFTGLSFRY